MKLKVIVQMMFWALLSYNVFSQGNALLTEKPGTFEILSRTDYTTPECGFAKTDIIANLERIKEVVSVVRQNPVLSDIKGFNGRARIYTMSMTCKRKSWYGVPSRVSFEFSSFFLRKDGTTGFNTIEPPEWSIYINDIFSASIDIFNARDNYFTVPLRKETIEPGIDVYDGELWVLYDPSRPPYWVPVTVEEAFESVREDIKNTKDEIQAKYFKEFFDREYAEIPTADHTKRAYFGGNLSRVSATPGITGQDSIFPYIMKVNPEYWNKSLPKSSIQFIWFRSVRNKQYMKSRLDECMQYWKKGSGSGCDLSRFELSFGMTDIRKLAPLIGK